MEYIHDPKAIEARSFEIITETLGQRDFTDQEAKIIKRVIHTTADFEYADILEISQGAVEIGLNEIKKGSNIITDTKMAYSGINKTVLEKFGGEVHCFISDEEVAHAAKMKGITRAMASMDVAVQNPKNKIFAIGNAPTALFRLKELIEEGKAMPSLIIGVPVGFVNVVESKEAIKELGIPYIISNGRKGGSTVAAAIVNALLYMMGDKE
ncbi:precorrin-8X methylmutase [Petroclostridium xylanilyticum]|jgi:precorrin-8X/cobalt-precorrin-8 methylmutase|uniref:precorrin-8X methylmutase n=1 Tax=Petroclostridium xylanilyticum TaxID=1792311 RepID=UPI000B9944EC|nr:precorrin-8X methylmutase [Petroclostridium xylanilyticum]